MSNLLKSLLCCCSSNDSMPPSSRGHSSVNKRASPKRLQTAVKAPAANSAPGTASPQEHAKASENPTKAASSAQQFLTNPNAKPSSADFPPGSRSGSVEPESLKKGTSLPRDESPQPSQHYHSISNCSASAASRRDSPSRPHSVINNADIPLDYVNADAESMADIAIKGRRQSSSLLTTAPTPSNSDETSPQSFSLPPNIPASATRHIANSNGEAGGSDFANLNDATASLTAEDVAAAAEMYRENAILLAPQAKNLEGRKVLVLDLDETLVHSSFQHTWDADFVIPVEIENTIHDVYVVKRPGVDEFLEKMSQMYEVIVFTASVAKYGDPLLDRLDPHKFVHHRLFRESCQNFGGSYVKNLSMLGRPISSVIIVDNSPAAYAFHPFNAVPVSSWFSDIHDNELLDMVPFLDELSTEYVPDVTTVLRSEW